MWRALFRFVRRHPRPFQVLAVIAAVPLLLVAGIALFYVARSFRYSLDKVAELPQRTLVLDRHGESLGHVYGHGENRLVVKLDEVSPLFVKALLAREDSRFYWHGGVDYLGVIRALRRNLEEERTVQGASTLTMQLARNSFGLTEKSLDRKLVEVALAWRIEARFSKKEILELYMNRVYFGSGLFGVERAAQGYFMKPAADLNLAESAVLAGIIRGPSRFSPFRSLEAAKAQQREVLARMRQSRMITAEQQQTALAAPLALRPENDRQASPGYVVQQVYDDLSGFLKPEQISLGGLRIHTTIDSRLQGAAQRSLQTHLAAIEKRPGYPHPVMEPGEEESSQTPYLQGAVVALDNASGGILALVGGRDYDDSSFNRALHAQRQVGSTFKPFVYAEGFARGLRPGTLVSDGAIDLPIDGGKRWRPENSDGTFGGPTPAEQGLIRSRNTMSVRVGQVAGWEAVAQLAKGAGIQADLPSTPVLYLGAFECDPLTLTSAYSVLANLGVKRWPYLIESIENAAGETLYRHVALQTAVLSPSVAWLTDSVLEKAVNEGTGRAARELGYKAPCYGKTGTTNDYHDAWFAGFTDKITCGVWVGLDRPQTIMKRGYGSALALPVWIGVMMEAEKAGFTAEPIPPPSPLVDVRLCRECGLVEGWRSIDPYSCRLPRDLVSTQACTGHFGALTLERIPQDSPLRAIGRLLFGRKRR